MLQISVEYSFGPITKWKFSSGLWYRSQILTQEKAAMGTNETSEAGRSTSVN